MAEEKKDSLNIELSEDVAGGTYSNLAVITHSNAEFIVDFVKVMPGMPKASVMSRIILTPHHAKKLWQALEDNIDKFEAINGPIGDVDSGSSIPLNFGGPTAQA